MITSQCMQRMALSAVLLVLPLIIYCSEIVGNPHSAVESAHQVKTVTSSVTSAVHRPSKEDEALARRTLLIRKIAPGPDRESPRIEDPTARPAAADAWIHRLMIE